MLTGHSPVWGVTVPRGPCSTGGRVEGGEHPDGAAEVGDRQVSTCSREATFPVMGRAHKLPPVRLRARGWAAVGSAPLFGTTIKK